jgi:hypothetical protein
LRHKANPKYFYGLLFGRKSSSTRIENNNKQVGAMELWQMRLGRVGEGMFQNKTKA